jgi:flagellar basal body rod protein FlgG
MSCAAKVPPRAAVSTGMATIPSVLQTALGGIAQNLRRLDAAAQKIATAEVTGAEPSELTEPLVEALQAQRAIEASAAVMRRADEALGSLLDALR